METVNFDAFIAKRNSKPERKDTFGTPKVLYSYRFIYCTVIPIEVIVPIIVVVKYFERVQERLVNQTNSRIQLHS